ncbi:hypothetical protein [Dactylosporangium sp. NPDC000521]|uniref:hypothetical protein n=1 Tax=Dactylosporangium sp. NPDC000521 TaxID=3363975 RepID=UPI0036B0509C
MDRIEAMLAAVDWSVVQGGLWGNHEGPMSAVPEMVRDLWRPERIWDAVDVLETAGFEFGKTRPVTPLLARVLVAVLADPRSATAAVYESEDLDLPLRAKLLTLLGTAATTAAWGGTDDELRATIAAVAADEPGLSVAELWAGDEGADRLAVRALAGEVLDAVLPFIDDPDVWVAHAAVFAATRFAQLQQLVVGRVMEGRAAPAGPAAVTEARLAAVARRGSGDGNGLSGVSGAAAYALAQLGADTSALLEHPALVVRACAALSPATIGDRRAVAALEEALRHTPANDHWLDPGSALQRLRLHIEFAAAAAARVTDFAELMPGALAVAAPEGGATEAGWGPLLLVAFRTGWQDRPLTDAQRAFLRQLVDNDDVWGDRARLTMPCLIEVGLPPDRAACQSLL